MWQLFGIRYPWDGIFHHCHWEPLSQAFGDKMNDMVHIIFQHQWKLDWKLATTSKNLTKVCSPPSPGGEHTFLTWILICCQVACNLFLAGCNMVLFIFFPICNIASFVERRLSLPDTILSLQVTLGIQKSNQQDGQLEALGVFWRSGPVDSFLPLSRK